ncbi:hypothetical protein COU36_02980 [Candidatus Micrarchaeota archaeon CG10_big_fil_rev_8_21_14_0_10_59_7]|nr:MAG: hypothetical protein COU36_02980 [Candidatus Micrarchaeota archaeon CG10_big_fil_rev_8_21_14_0_10_59_7]
MSIFEDVRTYDRLTGMRKILRRYFVMNAFDGALTTMGLVMGAFLGGLQDNSIVFFLGMSTATAVAISGFSGAFFAEEAERKKELRELERAMLSKLGRTSYGKAFRFATYGAALVDGVSPLAAALAILSPFLFLPVALAFLAAFAISFLLLFLLGAYLGTISRESMLGAGFKMVAAGGVALLASFLLYGVHF